MSGDPGPILWIVLATFFACAAIGAALETFLRKRLRTHHASIRMRLGKPSWWSGTQRALWAFLRFLWSREARALPDPVWRRVLHAYWMVSIVGVTAAVAFFASIGFRLA